MYLSAKEEYMHNPNLKLDYHNYLIPIVSQNGESEEMLGKHPLSGLEGAGAMLFILRKQFHSLLQTTADIMPRVRMYM
jgi:hypothetical protein